MIKQGAVKIDGEKVNDEMAVFNLDKPTVVQVGKRKFTRLIPG